MSFLDSSSDEDSGPPGGGGGPPGGADGPPGGGGGPPGAAPPGGGGGPLLAAIASRQRGPQVSAPGMGDVGQSMSLIQQAHSFLKQAMVGLPPGSPLEQDIGKFLLRLGRHLPRGAPGQGIQQTQLQDMLRNVVKNALISKIMGQMKTPRPGQGQQAAPPGAPPGAMAQAPNPSTPLPGA